MSLDLFFRTEDIGLDEILNYYVETSADRDIVDALKSRSPVILRGSRGVGKSFLLRTAEAELKQEFREKRVLPVYLTFARAGLITAPTAGRFQAWMIAKICNRIVRAATTYGLALPAGSAIDALCGGGGTQPSAMEQVESIFEDAWKGGTQPATPIEPPGVDVLGDAIEDLCRSAGLRRIILLVDEAAHVFIPEQQRQFFSLMRDLRSPYMAVKAAVYPGATSYGPTFQPNHDATVLSVDRSVTDDDYAAKMREIVYKQEASLRRAIEANGEVFDTLAFAATGNPRILLKTLARTSPFNRRNVQESIREYYREEIWAEHSSLSERYPGHADLVDWGRRFLEGDVLPALYRRNAAAPETSSFIWIHRNAPQPVREALRLLCYSGVLQEGVSGIRATRSEVGTRYMVNLGCQFALDADPVGYGSTVRSALSVKRMVEFGANHPAYRPIDELSLDAIGTEGNEALLQQLKKPVDRLDITYFLRERLHSLELETIGDVLASNEQKFMEAWYVGPTRARQMRNAAIAAVLEYLSG
ncbi:hypothetical protein [Cellulomonas endophytica]|uniref:hypothetical protein n=1 Tax=Cellulomonas endophytica TaxID=2494735 RepID=UPI001011596A|nr:hypothetical protein [Cellulomonas endophytica]